MQRNFGGEIQWKCSSNEHLFQHVKVWNDQQNQNKPLKSVTVLGNLNKWLSVLIYFYLEPIALDHNHKGFTKKFVQKFTIGYF